MRAAADWDKRQESVAGCCELSGWEQPGSQQQTPPTAAGLELGTAVRIGLDDFSFS